MPSSQSNSGSVEIPSGSSSAPSLVGRRVHQNVDTAVLPQNRAAEPVSLERARITNFEMLPDGSMLELVALRETSSQIQLLHWSNSGVVVTHRLRFGEKVFAPPEVSASLVCAVRLPTRTSPSGTVGDLFIRISEFFRRFVSLSDEMLVRVVAYVLATWFPETAAIAPLLWITGPPASGKTTLLQLLHCVCRRPLLVTDLTPATLYSLPALLKPTLLVDECEFGTGGSDQHILRLIRAGSTPGMHVPRNGQLFDLFCPKAVASRLWPDDDAVTSRAVFVTMLPTQRVLPAFGGDSVADEVDAIQAELLDFRLRNFHSMKTPRLEGDWNLKPRTLQIARSLAAPFLNDKILERRLVSSLEKQDQDLDAVRHDQPECVLVEALFRLAHEKPVGDLFVQEIADRVDRILAQRGDDRRFKPRRVGSMLRSLGIKTERLGSWGRGIGISPQCLESVHRLAQTFGITRRDTTGWMALKNGYGAGPPCALCEKFGLNVQLRFVPRPTYKPRRQLIVRDPAVEADNAK